MRITSILMVVVVGGSLLTPVSAQRRRHSGMSDVRVSKDRPTVYITFERVGNREPRRSRESSEGVWLRLHNNTRWRIDLQAHGLSNVFLEGNEKEVAFYYHVAAVPKPSTRYREIPFPSSPVGEQPECEAPLLGYGDLRSGIELPPGKSILFSVPREHVCKNLYVIVDFRYAWESGRAGEPQHSVRFYGSDIPQVEQ